MNEEEITISTYDKNARVWAKDHNFSIEENTFADALKQFTKIVPKHSSVIEIGCGGGRDATYLSNKYNYLGTDASKGMIEFAKKNVPSADFMVCNLFNLADINKKFNAFWAAAVLLHAPKNKISNALGSIKNVLTNQAVGMIAIKDGNEEVFEIREKNGIKEERLFTYWLKKDFDKVLVKNGFKITSYNYKPVSERTNWHIYFVKLSSN